jgi:isopenicillin N synthase-like dioxygenase
LRGPQRDDAQLGEALADPGVMVLEGHGLDLARQRRAAAAGLQAFALPAEVKARYQGPVDGSQRGYLPLRARLPNGREALDRKEAWHARPAGHAAANLFPEEVPGFGPSVLALLDDLETLASRVLAGVEKFLALPDGHFAACMRDGDSLFRMNHYPDTASIASRDRFLAHRDFDLITLLFGASAPGLEVQSRRGEWCAVDSSETGMIVTAGELLEVESGGRILATPHRVVSPEDSDGGRSSMVYFVSPRPEVRLANGASAGSLVDARLREAGYA